MPRLSHFEAPKAQDGFGHVPSLPLHRLHSVALMSNVLLIAVQENLGFGEEPLYDEWVHRNILAREVSARHSCSPGHPHPFTAWESTGASSRSFMP